MQKQQQKGCYGIEFSVEGNVPFKCEGGGNPASTLIDDAVPNGEGGGEREREKKKTTSQYTGSTMKDIRDCKDHNLR